MQGERVAVGLHRAALLLLDDVAPDGAGDLERKLHRHGLVGSPSRAATGVQTPVALFIAQGLFQNDVQNFQRTGRTIVYHISPAPIAPPLRPPLPTGASPFFTHVYFYERKQPRQLSRTTLSCGRILNWARASRCACREAIRLGEREARTAKQPQGPAPARQRPVVSNSCFQSSEDSAVNFADAPTTNLKKRIAVLSATVAPSTAFHPSSSTAPFSIPPPKTRRLYLWHIIQQTVITCQYLSLNLDGTLFYKT